MVMHKRLIHSVPNTVAEIQSRAALLPPCRTGQPVRMIDPALNCCVLPLQCPDIEHTIDQKTHFMRRERLGQECVCSQTHALGDLCGGGVRGHEHDGGIVLPLAKLPQ